mmetsp:Transcript_37347/g.72944  ORF Transcript_37347/g.72944 Transcript_37347/m.72944 type:complete len:685 (+) Transcript_37347:209-2263(+)
MAPRAPAPTLTLRRSARNGWIGFGCSLGFLYFVSKFNDVVQVYKAKRNIKKGAKVDKGLWRLLAAILTKACGPREATTVAMLSLSLLLRTFGSVWVSKHWGKIVKSIVTRNFPRMATLLGQFSVVTLGLAVLNALLKYYISTLKEQVREKVTKWCHTQYMRPKDMIYYKANKVGDDKIDNCDHQITSDVDKFSEIFAMVLSQSLKPMVDFVVYSVELASVQGLATPLTLYSWFAFASCVSTVTLPPFGELAAREQQLEGELRGAHSSLITNCEQVAFLGGDAPEKKELNHRLNTLLDHLRKSTRLNFNSECVRQYLNKYFVTVIGLILVARPVRLGLNGMDSASSVEVSAYFVSTWRNMEAMATSIQDLFELTNRIGRLSGFAGRVSNLMRGLERRPPVLAKEIAAARVPAVFKQGEDLRFQNVSVYRPDGTLLVGNLDLTVQRGKRVLVTGPNGCGKSSLFRVIRKLWPLVSGTITMPPEEEIYFLSQVNFVPIGSLRDLVTYPHSHEMMKARGATDEYVLDCLKWAFCSPEIQQGKDRADLEFTDQGVIIRPKLDDIRDWGKDLSPGQKQKLAFARLFYHKPSFVVLDECTNGISPDVEQSIYTKCSEMGLGVFSISHKIELKGFHDFELRYKGDTVGSWELLTCSDQQGIASGAYSGSTLSKGGVNVRKAVSDVSDFRSSA